VTSLAQADIDFGDDSGDWANDGECDDPRFAGTGMAEELFDTDIEKDATDCRTLFEAGSITLADEAGDGADDGAEDGAMTAGIDFGDDSGQWANDGECDDPRFTGSGMAAELVDDDIEKDATDCRTLFEAGSITLADAGDEPATPTADIDFGDDTSTWAEDGECDDPRFVGTGMAANPIDADLMKDATDCRTLFEAGSISLADDTTATPAIADTEIDFGDDSSTWANDDECDDPRFTGTGMASQPIDADLMKDATDCRTLFEAGSITLIDGNSGSATQIDFGSDTSAWANDGECDDLRFTGSAVAKKLLPEDQGADATDCRTLFEAGTIDIRAVYDPAYQANAPYDSSGIEFGNNTSSYANDGECDDPRFEGPDAAYTRLETDEFRDADDCRTAYEAGTVALVDAD
jgi:hypothetical protein